MGLKKLLCNVARGTYTLSFLYVGGYDVCVKSVKHKSELRGIRQIKIVCM